MTLKLLATFPSVCLCLAASFAQQPAFTPIALRISASHTIDSALPLASKTILLSKEGENVIVNDFSSKTAYNVKHDEDMLKFPIEFKDAHGSVIKVNVSASVKDYKVTGVVSDNPAEFVVFAEHLKSVWACSNSEHIPFDTTSSEEEMKKLTKNKGCIGWHRVWPP